METKENSVSDCMTTDLSRLVLYCCVARGECCPVCRAEWEYVVVGEQRFVVLEHRSYACATDKIFAYAERGPRNYDGPIFAPDVPSLLTACQI